MIYSTLTKSSDDIVSLISDITNIPYTTSSNEPNDGICNVNYILRYSFPYLYRSWCSRKSQDNDNIRSWSCIIIVIIHSGYSCDNVDGYFLEKEEEEKRFIYT